MGQQQRNWRYKMFSNTRSRFPLFLPMWDYKNLSWVWGWDRKIRPTDSQFVIIRWQPSDDNNESEGWMFSRVLTNGEFEGQIFLKMHSLESQFVIHLVAAEWWQTVNPRDRFSTEWSQTVNPWDRFFYPILTQIMDSFSCSPLNTSFYIRKAWKRLPENHE